MTSQNQQPTHSHDKIRSDLNLEQWPIWQPARSKSKHTRVLRKIIKEGKSTTRSAEVTVGYVDKIGTLTTEDQRTFYGLIALWEERGKSPDLTFFSLRALARVLGKRWGTRTIATLMESLIRLRTVPLIFKKALYDSATNVTIEDTEPFNILDDLKIVQRRKHGHITKEAGYYQFNTDVLVSLLNNHTKPVLLQEILKFKSEMAQVLYSHIDLTAYQKMFYHRKTSELFSNDLGITNESYKNVSDRLKLLKPAITDLKGKRTTSGVISDVRLVRTHDGKDYKLQVWKKKEKARSDGDEINLSSTISEIAIGGDNKAVQLVQYFHNLFHSVENKRPAAKEVKQAIAFIAQYGDVFSRYFVEFSYTKSKETNYLPQTFGGILQYASQAQKMFEKDKARRQHQNSVAACMICNSAGYFSIQNTDGTIVAVKCIHDQVTIESIIERKGSVYLGP